MSASNIMGMRKMQQRSEQSSRDADRTAREAELALRREEITMLREEMAMQMAMQREETRAHQQMMNVMQMAMMRNAGGSNHQQQRMDIGGPISSRGRTTRQMSSRTTATMSKCVCTE